VLIFEQRKDELDYWLTEHLRLTGLYWGLTALHLLGHPDALPRDKTLEFVFACQNNDGGFGAAPGHDSHMLYTVSAVQILATLNALPDLDQSERGGKLRIANCEFRQVLTRPGSFRLMDASHRQMPTTRYWCLFR
jgi:geranylgeranyl transferase type-2 subunit beta